MYKKLKQKKYQETWLILDDLHHCQNVIKLFIFFMKVWTMFLNVKVKISKLIKYSIVDYQIGQGTTILQITC